MRSGNHQHYFVVLGGSIIAEVVGEASEAVEESLGGRLLSHDRLASTKEGQSALAAWRRGDDANLVDRADGTMVRPNLTVVEDDD
jgi:hypothetical protein